MENDNLQKCKNGKTMPQIQATRSINESEPTEIAIQF